MESSLLAIRQDGEQIVHTQGTGVVLVYVWVLFLFGGTGFSLENEKLDRLVSKPMNLSNYF